MPTAETWLSCAVQQTHPSRSPEVPAEGQVEVRWGGKAQAHSWWWHSSVCDQLPPWAQLFPSTVLNHTWVRCWWGVKCWEHKEKVRGYLEPLSFPHCLAWHIKDVPHNPGRDNCLKHLGHGGFSVPWEVMPAELVAWHPSALLSQRTIFSTAWSREEQGWVLHGWEDTEAAEPVCFKRRGWLLTIGDLFCC